MAIQRPEDEVADVAPGKYEAFGRWMREHPLALAISFVASIVGILGFPLAIWGLFFTDVKPDVSAIVEPATVRIQADIDKTRIDILEGITHLSRATESTRQQQPSSSPPSTSAKLPRVGSPSTADLSQQTAYVGRNGVTPHVAARPQSDKNEERPASAIGAPRQMFDVDTPIAVIAPQGDWLDTAAARILSDKLGDSFHVVGKSDAAAVIEVSDAYEEGAATNNSCTIYPYAAAVWSGNASVTIRLVKTGAASAMLSKPFKGARPTCGNQSQAAALALDEALTNAKDRILNLAVGQSDNLTH